MATLILQGLTDDTALSFTIHYYYAYVVTIRKNPIIIFELYQTRVKYVVSRSKVTTTEVPAQSGHHHNGFGANRIYRPLLVLQTYRTYYFPLLYVKSTRKGKLLITGLSRIKLIGSLESFPGLRVGA